MVKLEEGKRYIMRDGRVTLPIKRDRDAQTSYYSFIGGPNPGDALSWSNLGEYIVDEEDSRDLVAEYVEPAAEVPAEEPTKVKKIDYDILIGETPGDLAVTVTECLNSGWTLVGSAQFMWASQEGTTVVARWYQTLVREVTA